MAKMKVAILCSKGGHMQEMMALRSAWGKYDYHIITFKSDKFKDWDEPHTFVIGPWDSVFGYIRTSLKALKDTMFDKPDIVISTGMGYFDILMFPLCKLIGIKTIYIEGAASCDILQEQGSW